MPQIHGLRSESYEDFYAQWSGKQEELMQELQEAMESDMKEDELQRVVVKVQSHYELYYEAKAMAAHEDVVHVMVPEWRSPLERAFLWVGGWRPSMVFQLVYALAGQQIEAELTEFLEGIDTPTMAGLSSKQLERISYLQERTHEEEEDLCCRMALLQQAVADQPLVGLAINNGDCPNSKPFEDAVAEKLKFLEDLLVEADGLRLCTLKSMLSILFPLQSAQFLVAAAQLQIATRQIGQKKQTHSLSNCIS